MAAAIWLGTPLVSVIIMPMLTNVRGVLPLFVYFALPAIALIASALLIQGTDIFRSIFPSKAQRRGESREHQNGYGRSAVWVCALTYTPVGFLFGLFSEQPLGRTVLTFVIIGAVWGYIVHRLFRSGVFDPLEDF